MTITRDSNLESNSRHSNKSKETEDSSKDSKGSGLRSDITKSVPVTEATTHRIRDVNNPPKGYIVVNRVSHSRFLPEPSKHAFVYPTLTFFLDIDALDNGDLNLGQLQLGLGTSSIAASNTNTSSKSQPDDPGHAFLFGVGSRPWTRVTNVRPSSYLMDDGVEGRTFRSRLQEFMTRNGLEGVYRQVEDVWLTTSPSYLGYEGINPLSVWYCYGKDKRLLVVLLEVHNTFGERHVYILQTGVSEDDNLPKGINHQWTIPRQFHVSPFNDRSGYYTCILSNVNHPHSSTSGSSILPKIRLNLLTSSKELKLTAIMSATESQPLTTKTLLATLARYPLLLFLSLVRISYHAMILHFEKRLDVYPRPEPILPAERDNSGQSWLRHSWNVAQSHRERKVIPSIEDGGRVSTRDGTSVGWQKEDWLQRIARNRVDKFLKWRTEQLGYRVELIPANPVDRPVIYGLDSSLTATSTTASDRAQDQSRIKPIINKLTIYYNTPLFFTHLLVLPSATHTLLLGSKVEGIFEVSDEELFLEIFEPSPSTLPSRAQRIRKHFLPSNAPSLPCPPTHFLDQDYYKPADRNDHSKHARRDLDNLRESISTTWNTFSSIGLVVAYYWLEWLERYVYILARARFVKGMEPWNGWGRLRMLNEMIKDYGGRDGSPGVHNVTGDRIGSVRREWRSV